VLPNSYSLNSVRTVEHKPQIDKIKAMQAKQQIRIDIVSDVVCPWCYIGKRRLEKALDQLNNSFDFEIEYHAFELNPDMPATGVNHKKYLSQKFGGEARYEQLTSHTAQVAAEEGLKFDFDDNSISPNTRKAHAIIQFAKASGKQLPVMEALFKAYFTQNINLADDKNLVDVAVSAGMDRSEVESLISTDDALVQVALAEKEIAKLGVSGVPFYIINNRYGISGAQATETFVKALQEIAAETTPLAKPAAVEAADAEACDVDNKNC